jgi:hypothetical protein
MWNNPEVSILSMFHSKGKGKVATVLNKAPRHEDVLGREIHTRFSSESLK